MFEEFSLFSDLIIVTSDTRTATHTNGVSIIHYYFALLDLNGECHIKSHKISMSFILVLELELEKSIRLLCSDLLHVLMVNVKHAPTCMNMMKTFTLQLYDVHFPAELCQIIRFWGDMMTKTIKTFNFLWARNNYHVHT